MATNSQIKEMANLKLQQLAVEATTLNNKVKSAKTNIKKKYYRKKLKKVNEVVMKMLQGLDKIEKNEEKE